jgi:hypothetical protein
VRVHRRAPGLVSRLVSTRDDYRLPAALIAAVRAVITEQLIDPNLWTFWTEQTRSGRSHSSATLYDATRCSDRTRYPDGRMVATAPRHRRSIQDAASEVPRIPIPRTRVNSAGTRPWQPSGGLGSPAVPCRVLSSPSHCGHVRQPPIFGIPFQGFSLRRCGTCAPLWSSCGG